MKKEEDNVVDIPDEDNDFYSDDGLFEISSWGADLSFRELIIMYDQGELIKPEIQRHYVWDKSEASRFIESLLLGLPVPSIFLAKSGDQKLIVDGYQRIMTVYDFVKGIFSTDGSVFKLSTSPDMNERWRGKTFAQLTEGEQRRIQGKTIHSIIFEQKKPTGSNTSMYQVFERINTGGRALLPQEIRNCVYQGKFNSLLIELNKDSNWRALYGLPDADPRMKDIEFILRFFSISSFLNQTASSQRISLKKILNETMGTRNSDSDEVLNKLADEFKITMKSVHDNLGENAFFNYSFEKEEYVDKFHPTLFDSISIATLIALKKNQSFSDLERKKLDLLKNKSFNEYITVRTTNVDHIVGRISLALKTLYGEDYEQQTS